MAEADPLQVWVSALSAALGIDTSHIEFALLLDVARDAAHNVARPAAPVTTFLVGLAAGLAGGGSEEVVKAAMIAQQLAMHQDRAG